ncbi:MAG: reverse transcriptase/maturase family protein [Oscillospiraceae bacterium]|nr:MAG: reverse transcriptase/maturase family protein [Oscillospiraceae bacterium]
MLKVKEYADEGYQYAVCLDLSKYFDTLNHELLMNMLRQEVKDKRLTDLIKKYLKSGVMENGIVMKNGRRFPQGGNLSPLLANIYLDKFDKEFEGRGVKVIRYADDIILLAGSIRAAERLLGTSTSYLEKKLKLKVNTEKEPGGKRLFNPKFRFLGFAMGRNRKGTYIRVHAKSKKKAKEKRKKTYFPKSGQKA